MQTHDLYAVLSLDPQASSAEISRAYRSQLRRHHPDANPEAQSKEQQAAERSVLQAVMDAYAVLGNATARSAYDRDHTPAGRAPRPARGARGTGFAGPAVVAGPVVWTPWGNGGLR